MTPSLSSHGPLAIPQQPSRFPRFADQSLAPCPEHTGCQRALMHGRFCVHHCPCTACQQIRATVAERLAHVRSGEVRE